MRRSSIVSVLVVLAILSAASTMANQNIWIEWMKEELKLPEYANMSLVSIVYGDDLREKSYNEAIGLFRSYPDLRGIIAPTTVGIAAAESEWHRNHLYLAQAERGF